MGSLGSRLKIFQWNKMLLRRETPRILTVSKNLRMFQQKMSQFKNIGSLNCGSFSHSQ